MDIKNFIEGLGEKKVELLKKAALCKSADELFALAKENSVDLNEEDATELFAQMEQKQGKLSDDELDSVAGGVIAKGWGLCPKCDGHTVTTDGTSYRCIQCGYIGLILKIG